MTDINAYTGFILAEIDGDIAAGQTSSSRCSSTHAATRSITPARRGNRERKEP
jgi:hypothetical protein